MTDCEPHETQPTMRGKRRRRRKVETSFGLWTALAILIIASIMGPVSAIPVAQAVEDPLTSTSSSLSSTSITTPSPSQTVSSVSSTSTSDTSTSSSISSSTTSIPGTVVTDSPLVRSKSSSSELALPSGGSSASRNASTSIGSATTFISTTASTAGDAKTPVPSPTSNDGTAPETTADEKTYNTLANLYFLLLGAAIALAVLAWYLWRRRRKGKTTRDQRRGLEALRRDLELGRLRRGLRGVVGRGGGNTNHSPSADELPAYTSSR
jgi:cytoskeletal protein RodZ